MIAIETTKKFKVIPAFHKNPGEFAIFIWGPISITWVKEDTKYSDIATERINNPSIIWVNKKA